MDCTSTNSHGCRENFAKIVCVLCEEQVAKIIKIAGYLTVFGISRSPFNYHTVKYQISFDYSTHAFLALLIVEGLTEHEAFSISSWPSSNQNIVANHGKYNNQIIHYKLLLHPD